MLGPQTKLALEQVAEVSDGMGGMTSTWSHVTYLSGVLTAGGNTSARFAGRETMAAGQLNVLSTLIFYCDYPSGVTVTEKNRMVYGTRIFDIEFVYNPGNMNHHLEITLFEIK